MNLEEQHVDIHTLPALSLDAVATRGIEVINALMLRLMDWLIYK